eukprot:366573-Chlamydomonas_euryale.AAC.28
MADVHMPAPALVIYLTARGVEVNCVRFLNCWSTTPTQTRVEDHQEIHGSRKNGSNQGSDLPTAQRVRFSTRCCAMPNTCAAAAVASGEDHRKR